jgi:squalene synthase HpnC
MPVESTLLEAGWSRLPASYRIPESAPSIEESFAYCERLAKTHYENFSVATWFLPSHLKQHFYNVYAYCRISDDLGDEVGNAEQSIALLDAWEEELNACYAGAPRHAVFIALRETILEFEIPKHEFSDLLVAFRRDQTITRFPAFDDVVDYCKYSANPVGHLVLYLGGYSDPERQQLSDFTCTALQLANFWQDVSVDYGKGRIYLPGQDKQRYGETESDFAERRFTPAFRELIKFEVERARDWFDLGLPLITKVRPDLALDIELFSRGGQEILNAIEAQDYNVIKSRPAISKPKKLLLVLRAAARKVVS